MMEVRNLRKTYTGTHALNGVSFVAADGLVTALLGPNGAGKTTTTRALTGLVRPDAGAALIDGLIAGTAPARSRIGALPEVVGLYDRLTVREHLWYAGRLYGMTDMFLSQRIDELLEDAGLHTVRDKAAGTLSFGQKRRVALARALVHRPRNILLDEPTNGLDVMSIRHVRGQIRRLACAGCAVILSSHAMAEVAAVSDRVVVLASGRVVAQGTPDELLRQTGCLTLEEAFVRSIGSDEGLN